MDKEFVTYKQALALKELGFDWECLSYISSNTDVSGRTWTSVLKAPLKQQVFRWFREKYELNHIIIKAKSWFCLINGVNHQQQFTTYEEAENACIDKLLEIAKQQKDINVPLST